MPPGPAGGIGLRRHDAEEARWHCHRDIKLRVEVPSPTGGRGAGRMVHHSRPEPTYTVRLDRRAVLEPAPRPALGPGEGMAATDDSDRPPAHDAPPLDQPHLHDAGVGESALVPSSSPDLLFRSLLFRPPGLSSCSLQREQCLHTLPLPSNDLCSY